MLGESDLGFMHLQPALLSNFTAAVLLRSSRVRAVLA